MLFLTASYLIRSLRSWSTPTLVPFYFLLHKANTDTHGSKYERKMQENTSTIDKFKAG